MTLNPDIAHDELILSEDLKLMICGFPHQKFKISKRVNTLPCVLDWKALTLGRYYFEVDMEEGIQWNLGIFLEYV